MICVCREERLSTLKIYIKCVDSAAVSLTPCYVKLNDSPKQRVMIQVR